jgi:2-keto-3-deoxy-L-rhamnonate aldolase RhmA
VGTNDLTADLGCPGDIGHPEVRKAIAAIAAAAARHGKLAIIGGVGDGDAFLDLLANGFAPFVFAGIDTDVIANGLVQRSTEWRQRLTGRA